MSRSDMWPEQKPVSTQPKQDESWAPIAGTGGLYEVSTKGRVRSVRKGIILKPNPNSEYPNITMSIDNLRQQRAVHRLVAEAFIDNPSDKPQVNHKDGNKRNNVVGNLEWATGKENTLHSYRVLGHKGLVRWFGEGPTARPVLQLTLKGDFVHRWDSASRAAAEGAFHAPSISEAARGKLKQHKGFLWAYEPQDGKERYL